MPSATRFSSKRRRRGRCRIKPHTEQLLTKVFRDNRRAANTGTLYEQAVCCRLARAGPIFAGTWQISSGEHVLHATIAVGSQNYMAYFSPNFKDILRQCDKHGVEHRLPVNLTR